MAKTSDEKVKAILKKFYKAQESKTNIELSDAEWSALVFAGYIALKKPLLFGELRRKANDKKESTENREIFHSVLFHSQERGEKRKLKNQEIKAGRKEWVALKRRVARKKAK